MENDEMTNDAAVAWLEDLTAVLDASTSASATPLVWIANENFSPEQTKAWLCETVENTVAAGAFSGSLHGIAEEETGQVVAFTGCGPTSAANAKFLIWCVHFVLKHKESLIADATTVAELRAEVERLQALSAAISRDCNECANQRNGANAKAAAAERRVAELEAGVSVLAKRWRAEAVKLREQAGRALRRENAGYFPAVPHSELASAANDADSYAAELEALTKESP